MEEERRKGMRHLKCPGMLDFNAPLLSTRRSSGNTKEQICCTNSQGKLQETGDRIPFCWEQAPGKPKDSQRSDNMLDGDTPRLRLPPGRWHPQKQGTTAEDFRVLHQDDDCEADLDDHYDGENDNDVFSDAMEVLSLTEAIDIVEKAEQNHGLDGFNLESLGHNESISPSYIIERFLPDATALAASSVINVSRNLSKKLPYVCNQPEACVSEGVGSSYSLPKGCGLEMLLPWRMKHRICGVKSPVKHVASATIQLQSKTSTKNKRSIVRPFGDHVKKHTGCISYSV